ncbi:permease [Thermosulfurimonas marina]|uniref:Permease n=1 Tax=Thermosulfurimonas marina TaxID=2047767 RepID=A0A6H1WTJ5_9BACT|nr:permease [Thermosulfurimonas marina]QJA06469.1 permease [Thermosulfurimonas marina]
MSSEKWLLLYLSQLGGLFLEAAPYLLLGLLLAGLLRVFVSEDWLSRHLGGHTLKGALKAALLGLPLPLCSCGVLPAAVGLYRAGAGLPATFAFLVATPQTSADAILLAYGLLGGVFALAYPLSALWVALWVALAVRFLVGESPSPSTPLAACACCAAETSHQHTFGERVWTSLLYAVEELLADLSRPLAVGFLLAALVALILPPGLAERLSAHGLVYPAMILVGLPLYVCATASIPLAYTLLLKGFSPGAVLVFLVTGPATNLTSITVLSRLFGLRTVTLYLLALILAALTAGLALDTLFPGLSAKVSPSAPEGPSLLNTLSAALLALLLLREILWKPLWKDREPGCACQS